MIKSNTIIDPTQSPVVVMTGVGEKISGGSTSWALGDVNKMG